MKKIIILLLTLLMSACSVVKPSETLSSMQTEPTAETTVAETAAPEETTEPTPKETEPVIETPKAGTTAPYIDECSEQKPAPETTAVTIVQAPIEPINTETTAEPPATPKPPAEAVEKEEPTELPESVETPPESVTEPPKTEFDSTTGLTLQGPTRSKSGLKSTRQRWTAGTTRRPPTPTAFTLSGT